LFRVALALLKLHEKLLLAHDNAGAPRKHTGASNHGWRLAASMLPALSSALESALVWPHASPSDTAHFIFLKSASMVPAGHKAAAVWLRSKFLSLSPMACKYRAPELTSFFLLLTGDVLRTMKEGSRAWSDTDRLLTTAFKGIGGLSMATIERHRQEHKARAARGSLGK
jgi:hypothetical protein